RSRCRLDPERRQLGIVHFWLVLHAGRHAVYRLRHLYGLFTLRRHQAGPGAVQTRIQSAELVGDVVCRRHRHRFDVLLGGGTGHAVYAAAGRGRSDPGSGASGDGVDAVSLRSDRLVDVCADGHRARLLQLPL
ncbi:dihydrolipoamide dehydrogenase, partial [Corchorus olitorius]